MTAHRLAHATTSPALTGGDDRPRPNCDGNYAPFDALDERRGGPAPTDLIAEVRAMCDTCPIQPKCHADNADTKWLRAITPHHPDFVGDRRRAANGKRTEERLRELEECIAEGLLLEDVMARHDMTRIQVYKWCHRHHRLDIWRQLTPHLKANQYRKESAA